MTDAPAAAAGWYPDPEDPGLTRYWTGTRWTEDRAPAVAPPTTTSTTSTTLVRFAKTTTVGVLLWLFLGTLGAHRHYVGKHIAALFQPLLYITGSIMMFVGITTVNPGGTGPNMTLFSAGVAVNAVTALWVIIDVFFIAGWVRRWNDAHASG